MTYLLKDPDAVLDYAVDWGAEYLGDDAIAASAWSATPDEEGGLTIGASECNGRVASVQLGGGTAGHIYRVVNRITTGYGRTDERSIVLRVEQR